jgi:hypothetical protein
VRLLLGGGRVCRMVLLVLGRICALHGSEEILDVVCKISTLLVERFRYTL